MNPNIITANIISNESDKNVNELIPPDFQMDIDQKSSQGAIKRRQSDTTNQRNTSKKANLKTENENLSSLTNMNDKDNRIIKGGNKLNTVHDNSNSLTVTYSNLNSFDTNNKGPYGVWIKKITNDGVDINAYKIGSILYKKHKNILDIHRKNKVKAEVIFKTRAEANKLLTDNSLSQYNLEAFLPGFRKQRKGLVKNIPAKFTSEEIVSACKSNIEVIDVKRLNMRNKNSPNENNKWIPSQTVVITFAGQSLPKDIFIFNVKTYIEPYVSRPMQCYNCYKFGHTSKTCKKEKLCPTCGGLNHDDGEICNLKPCCVNCNGEHKSFYTICPIYKEQLQINVIMAYDNVSFFEARNKIKGITQTPAKTKENFPPLKQQNTTKYYRQALIKGTTNQLSTQATQEGSTHDYTHQENKNGSQNTLNAQFTLQEDLEFYSTQGTEVFRPRSNNKSIILSTQEKTTQHIEPQKVPTSDQEAPAEATSNSTDVSNLIISENSAADLLDDNVQNIDRSKLISYQDLNIFTPYYNKKKKRKK